MPDDSDLLRKALAGGAEDRQAFARVVLAAAHKACLYLTSKGKMAQEAMDDVVSEVAGKWAKILYEGRELTVDHLNAYTAKMVDNSNKNWLRARQRCGELKTIRMSELVKDDESLMIDLADDLQDLPGQRLEIQETQAIVLDFLNSLPERDRQILCLRREGHSYADIAERLGITTDKPDNVVGLVIYRARRALAKKLGLRLRKRREDPRNEGTD